MFEQFWLYHYRPICNKRVQRHWTGLELHVGCCNTQITWRTSNGGAFLPVNHSSAVSEGTSPAVSGYKSSWNNSDCINNNTFSDILLHVSARTFTAGFTAINITVNRYVTCRITSCVAAECIAVNNQLRIWNSLPRGLRTLDISYKHFKALLKTYVPTGPRRFVTFIWGGIPPPQKKVWIPPP